jgi:hypothetical protein
LSASCDCFPHLGLFVVWTEMFLAPETITQSTNFGAFLCPRGWNISTADTSVRRCPVYTNIHWMHLHFSFCEVSWNPTGKYERWLISVKCWCWY